MDTSPNVLPILGENDFKTFENVVKNTKFFELEREVDENRRTMKAQEERIINLEIELKYLLDSLNKGTIKSSESISNSESSEKESSIEVTNDSRKISQRVTKTNLIKLLKIKEGDISLAFPKCHILNPTKICVFNAEPVEEILLINSSKTNYNVQKIIKMKQFNFVLAITKMSKMPQFSKFIADKENKTRINFDPKEAILEIIDILDDMIDPNLRFIGLILQLNWLFATKNFSSTDDESLSYICNFAKHLDSEFNIHDLFQILESLSDDVVSRLMYYFNWDVYSPNAKIDNFFDLAAFLNNLKPVPTKINVFARFLEYRNQRVDMGTWLHEYIMIQRFLKEEIEISRFIIDWENKIATIPKECIYDIQAMIQKKENINSKPEFVRCLKHNSRIMNKLHKEVNAFEHMAKYLNLFSRVVFLTNEHKLSSFFPKYFTFFLKEVEPFNDIFNLSSAFPEIENEPLKKPAKKIKPIPTGLLFSKKNLDIMKTNYFSIYSRYRLLSTEVSCPSEAKIPDENIKYSLSLDIKFVSRPMNPDLSRYTFLMDAMDPFSKLLEEEFAVIFQNNAKKNKTTSNSIKTKIKRKFKTETKKLTKKEKKAKKEKKDNLKIINDEDKIFYENYLKNKLADSFYINDPNGFDDVEPFVMSMPLESPLNTDITRYALF
ncbi:hypothetical protein ACO0SA_004151 [Hanseniaspora valbyensis]